MMPINRPSDGWDVRPEPLSRQEEIMAGKSVLAVGAHPDDIELGCGATLLAHAAAGDIVTMLVMTGGESGPGATSRHGEQRSAARALGASLRWGGLRDCSLVADSATVAIVESVLSDAQADLIYVHAPEDSHQDHRATAAATLSAARRLSRVLHYQSPSTLSFAPTVFVDVTAFLGGKLAALGAHSSQVEHSAMVEPDAVQASARHWGAQARIGYAEAFAPTRMVLDLAPAPALVADRRRASGRTVPAPRRPAAVTR
jgi:LmbE family N-acetylglucosaminyl deacetylase